MRISHRLRQQVLVTLGGVAAYRIGLLIPLPGVDGAALSEFWAGPHTAYGTAWMLGSRMLSRAAVFSLGLGPYITGAALVLLLSGGIPFLRRLRDGTPDQHDRFDGFIYGAAILVSAVQAWGIALFLESVVSPRSGLPVVPDPGWSFRLLALVTLTSGSMCLVWIADQITLKGIANGVAVLILAGIVSDLVYSVLQGYQAYLSHGGSLAHHAILLIGLVGLASGATAMICCRRSIPLRYVGQVPVQPGYGGSAPVLPLRPNTVGVVPFYLSLAVLSLLTHLGLFPASDSLRHLSAGYWIAFCGLVFLGTYLYTAVTFDARELVQRMRSYGYTADTGSSPADAAAFLERTVERLIWPFALFLCGIAFLPILALRWLGVHTDLSLAFGPNLLVVCAVCTDAWQQIRVERAMDGRNAQAGADGAVEWTAALAAETGMEVELARGVLSRAGIESVGQARRAIATMGTLALWEVSRPPFPSLTIHRRLGKGQAAVLVPAARAEEARQVLAAQTARSASDPG